MPTADSVTMTVEGIKTAKYIPATIIKVTIAWTAADPGGTVTTTAFPAAVQKELPGRMCIMGTTSPGTGAATPQDNYDIYILDALGVDIFGAALNNRSSTVKQQAIPLIATSTYGSRLVADQLSFKLDGNNVAAATGTCVLYFGFPT